MNLEVDQSRKVEQSGPTTLAFSNHEYGTIQVSAKVKGWALRQLREQGRGWQMAVYLVFSALLALLLRDVIGRADRIVIDDEYTGHRGLIKFQVMHYLRKLGVEVETDVITFGFVGKHSPAHDLAFRVFRGKQIPDHHVTFAELWALVHVGVNPSPVRRWARAPVESERSDVSRPSGLLKAPLWVENAWFRYTSPLALRSYSTGACSVTEGISAVMY